MAIMPVTATGAQKRAETIRKYLDALTGSVDAMADRLARAYELRDWEALGYQSWSEYCEREFGTHMVKLAAGIRKAWRPALTAAGMSTAEIAAACGVNRKTIQRDSKPRPASWVVDSDRVRFPSFPRLGRERRAPLDRLRRLRRKDKDEVSYHAAWGANRRRRGAQWPCLRRSSGA